MKVLTWDSGHIGGQGCGDIIFANNHQAFCGPFSSLKDFHDRLASLAAGKTIEENPNFDPRQEWADDLGGLDDNLEIVFTHADLCKVNILVSPSDDFKLLAIVDWHQSGWYPKGWEWLKAQAMCDFSNGDWDTEWLKPIISPEDRPDEKYYYAYEYIRMIAGV